jgi:cell division protein FtsB
MPRGWKSSGWSLGLGSGGGRWGGSRRRSAPGGHGGWGGRLRSGRIRLVGVLALIGAFYALYTLIGGEHGIVSLLALERKEADLRRQIAAVQVESAETRTRIRNLDRTIEEEARVQGYAGPHEEVYEIVRVDSLDAIDRFEDMERGGAGEGYGTRGGAGETEGTGEEWSEDPGDAESEDAEPGR